ncbi:DUF1398 domain-containing protein [Ancylobacter lacus]|uniref:DUF1398 domain-containing protein n=1 Tax=Ancylobacter lacus TaxID=2579970 RepID=UPI001FE66EF5|nr:DUF1398 domain-containing protein [Ancylobacter lacus]
MHFPRIVGALMAAGFESHAVDFRRARATCFPPDGQNIEPPVAAPAGAVAPVFDTAGLQATLREAQVPVPGYSCRGFCEKAVAAGCAGYVVSVSGRRARHLGRTAEINVEPFPQ